MNRHTLACLVGVHLILGAQTARTGESIAGPGWAFAADILIVRGAKVRLLGIIVPAPRETCVGGAGTMPCEALALKALDSSVAGRQLSCQLPRKVGHGSFQGTCWLDDGADVGAALLRAGWVRADSGAPADYIAAEGEAKAARRGLWATSSR